MKTALLVLDFINDIVHPDGKIAASAGYVKKHQVISHANAVITFSRENNIPSAFVKVGFNFGYPECPENSPLFGRAKEFQALQLNTWGTEFHEALDVKPEDLVIIKHRVSAFYSTSLEAFLRANQTQNLILIGVSTDMAIQSTAREAHDRDYKVNIISDACGAASLEIHESALKLLQRIAVITSSNNIKDEILK